MNVPPSRLQRLQADLRAAGLDGLLVSHTSNIRYLTGLDASAGLLAVGPDRSRLLVDFRYASAASQLAGAGDALAVDVVTGPMEPAAARVLREMGTRAGIEAGHLTVGRFNRIAAELSAGGGDGRGGAVTLVPTERLVERLRAVKDEAEQAVFREAGRRISAVAAGARHWVVAGRSELEVAADVDAAMRAAGFERPAFETIVASGPNGARPHARPTRRVLRQGDGVVLDFGGVYDGYCVDLTRTLHLGPMPAEFRRRFEAVRDAQAAAIAAVRPGAAAADIDAAARGVLESRGLGEAFGHGTGHGLGLEVHEEPRISKLAAAGERLVAGMVFTVEPGAYAEGFGGVRIEDDVLVTPEGCELLTDVATEL